jgi:hypothetical protein
MPRTWLRWTPDDGSATTALCRGFNRGLGLLLLASGLVCGSGTWQHDGPSQRLIAALTGTLLLVSAVHLLLGRVGLAGLVPCWIAAVVVVLVPDPTGSGNGFTGTLVFTLALITSVANLRHRVAAGLLVLSVPVYLLLTAPALGAVVDMLVLNIGMCFAALAFLGALVGSARLQDDLTDETTRLEVEAARRDLEQASATTVRRVLHDDVLSALRAIADLPPERQDQVRQAARDAVTAVRRQPVGP